MPTRTVSELERDGVLLVQDGNHGEYRPRRDEIVSNGTAHIRAADISDSGAIDFRGAQRINDVALARIRKGVGEGRDILLTHKGTIGRVGRVPRTAPSFVCSPQTTFWRTLNPGRLNQDYLYAYLRSPHFAAQLQTRMHDSDMAPYVSLTAQRSFSVPLPSIDEQRRVGAVLATLDDKVDSNRGLASVLEQTIATEFRARFVDLIADDAVDGSPFPNRWTTGVLGDVATAHREFVKGEHAAPYIGLDQMPRGSTVLTEWLTDDAPTGQAATFERGDILFGKLRPYFRKVGVAPIAGRCSTEILVLRPATPEHYGLLLGHVASDRFIEHCNAVSRGTRMPRAEWRDASAFEIAVPPAELALEFSQFVRTLYSQIIALTHQSRTLAAIRDALLPKLVSGEIRVPDTADPEELIGPATEDAAAA